MSGILTRDMIVSIIEREARGEVVKVEVVEVAVVVVVDDAPLAPYVDEDVTSQVLFSNSCATMPAT